MGKIRKIFILFIVSIFIIPLVYAEIDPIILKSPSSSGTIIFLNATNNDSIYWNGHAYSPLISQWTNDAGYITSFTDTNESLRFGNLTATNCPAGYKAVGVYTNGTIKCLIETAAVDTWQGNSSLVLNNITNWDVFYRTNASKNWTLDSLNQGASFFWSINSGSYNATYALYNDTFNATYASNLDTFAPNATGIFNNISINWTKKAYDEWGTWWKNQTVNLWALFDARYWGINSGSYNATYDAKIDTYSGTNATNISNQLGLLQLNSSINWTLIYNWSLPILNQINNTNLPSLNETYRTVYNNTFSGSIFPDTTLTYDIGSGANRWSKLWVANISSENIDTFNLFATYNVSAGRFLGNTSCENITGAASNLCTITPFGNEVDPVWQGNSSIVFANLSINYTNIVYTNWNTIWSSITNMSYRTVDNYTGLFTPSMFNVTNISYVDIKNTSIVLAGQENRTKSDCANITGAVSNLCTITPAGNEIDPVWQGNSSIVFANLSTNWTDLTIKLTNVTNDSYVSINNGSIFLSKNFNVTNDSYISINNISVNTNWTNIISLLGYLRNMTNDAIKQFNVTNDSYVSINNATINGFVPYTGANKPVDLGNNNFTAAGWALFAATQVGQQRVGIGTLLPAMNTKLHVQVDDVFGLPTLFHTDILLQDTSTVSDYAGFTMIGGTNGNSVINFGDSNDEDAGLIDYNHTGNFFGFGINGAADRMILNGSGIFTPWNVTASYFKGDGSLLTGIFTSSMFNTTNDTYVSIDNISVNTNWTALAIKQVNMTNDSYVSINNISVNRNQTLNALIQVNNTNLPSFNISYEGSLNNASYLSTYNATYDTKIDTWVDNYSNITTWASTWQANYTNYTQLWTAANQWQNNATNFSQLWQVALSWNNNYSNYTSLWNTANYNWTNNVAKNTSFVYISNTSYMTVFNSTANLNWTNIVFQNTTMMKVTNNTYALTKINLSSYLNVTSFISAKELNTTDGINATGGIVAKDLNATRNLNVTGNFNGTINCAYVTGSQSSLCTNITSAYNWTAAYNWTQAYNWTANYNWSSAILAQGNNTWITLSNATANYNWTNDVFRNSSLATNYNYTNDVFRNTSIVYISNTSYITAFNGTINLNWSNIVFQNTSLVQVSNTSYMTVFNATANMNWTNICFANTTMMKVTNNTYAITSLNLSTYINATGYIAAKSLNTTNGINVTNSANASIFGFGLGGYIQQAVAGIIRFFDVNVQIDRNLNVTKQANSSNSYIYGLSIDNTTKFKANLSYFGPSCIYDNGTTTIMERPCSQ